MFPFPSGAIASGVKLVQRGTFAVAGTATIIAVDTTKTVVHSVSKGSAGTVKTDSTVAATTYSGTLAASAGVADLAAGGTIVESGTIAAAALSGGTTDLYTKQYSAVLTNSTTLTADGPCEYQVIEYY